MRDYELSPTFATSAEAAAWCDRNLSYGKSVYGRYDAEGNAGLTHIKYRGHLRPLLTEAELRASVPATNHEGGNYARVMPVVDVQWGVANAARVMPVTAQQVIVWVAIYKKDKRRAVTAKQLFGGR